MGGTPHTPIIFLCSQLNDTHTNATMKVCVMGRDKHQEYRPYVYVYVWIKNMFRKLFLYWHGFYFDIEAFGLVK